MRVMKERELRVFKDANRIYKCIKLFIGFMKKY